MNGQLAEETLFNPYGAASQHNLYRYVAGHLQELKITNAVYDALNYTHYEYDTLGNLKHLVTIAPADMNPHGYTQTHDYTYELWDTYQQKTDTMVLNKLGYSTLSATSTREYDKNGLLTAVIDTPTQNNTMHYYANSIDGVRMRVDDKGETYYLTVAGKTIGDLRLNHNKTQQLNVYGGTLPDADRDNVGTYTLNAGDTLESIAFHIYGDSSLWYLIADANGITDRTSHAGEKGSQLQTGCRLTIPQITKGQHQSHLTHQAVSSIDWSHDTSPPMALGAKTPIYPSRSARAHHSFWKTLGQIAVAVTAAVVMVMSAGALALLVSGASFTGLGALMTAGLGALGGGAALGMTETLSVGFAAGFVSSIAGQTAAVAFNLQHGIDLKGALMTGLGTAATAGVSHILQTSTAYKDLLASLDKLPSNAFNVVSAAEMMERDAVNQSLNIALSHHQHFDWLELGVSAATAGVMGSDIAQNATEALQDKLHSGGAFVTSEVHALATGAASGHFDAATILQDNLGNAVAASLFKAGTTPEKAAILDTIEEGGYCPIRKEETEDGAYSPIPEGSFERFQREAAIRRRMDKAMANYLNDVRREEAGLLSSGSVFGVLGDAAYGDKRSLLVGQGALVAETSNGLSLDKVSPKIRYIFELYPSANAASKKTGLSLELMLAQGAQETGWGASVQPGTNNMFNIKKGNDWVGPVHVVKGALEYHENGSTYYERSEFRVYKNIEESVQDRINFLSSNRRYVDLFNPEIKGNVVKEAYVLQKAHYAGNNPHYADSLIKVANGPTMKESLKFARKYYGY